MQLHLIGDSVFQGRETDIRHHPSPALDLIRTPTAIINLGMGASFSRFSARTHMPRDVERAVSEIEAAFSSGVIQDGDVIASLDVGPHAMDTARIESDWLRIRTAATGRRRVLLIMCSGFDNGAHGLRDHLHEAPLDGRSPNDAVRAAARASGNFAGRTAYLDVAGPLKALHARLNSELGLSPYYRDGVHLTGWGQIFLSLLLLRRLDVPVPRLYRVVRAVKASHAELGARSAADAVAAFRLAAALAGFPASSSRLAVVRAGLSEAFDRWFSGSRPAPSPAASPAIAALVAEADGLLLAERPQDALPLYREASMGDPDSLRAHQGWIKSAVRGGGPDAVLEAGRGVLRLEPWESKYYVWVAQALLDGGATADDLDWIDDFAETRAPSNAFQTLADLNAAVGDKAREQKWSERALASQRAEP